MFRITLLIRKLRYTKRGRTMAFLLACYRLYGDLSSKYAELEHVQGKGFGNSAVITRKEMQFVLFIKHNFGVGDFTIMRPMGIRGFRIFWKGTIEEDRFMRIKGHIAPYIFSQKPLRCWHDLPVKIKEPGEE